MFIFCHSGVYSCQVMEFVSASVHQLGNEFDVGYDMNRYGWLLMC